VTDPARRKRVEEVCDAALDRDAGERAAFVAAACGHDQALRQEVEALLAHAQTAEGFLAAPIGAVAAQVLGEAAGASIVGRQIGPYTVLSLLGAGGMGQVYRARDQKLGRDVAIKVLPDIFLSDPERLARFEREARVLATLNHLHIGAIYGMEENEGVRALVLELVEGPTLAERLALGPLPIHEALTVARQIAGALDAAHQKGIIHRDLKPGNVKVTPDGTVKVLDFGLAKVYVREDVRPDLSQSPAVTVGGTHDGVILGTAAYMSPEQARGKQVDKRADIWSFGCVLYEMLTGRGAFAGDTLSDTIAVVLEREPDWSALPDKTPVAIRHLLTRCLEKDPQQRLRDIGDVRFDAIADDSADVASSAPVHGSRLRILAAASTAALVAALVVGGVFSLRRAPADVRAYRTSIPLPAGVKLPPIGGFALSPDGRRLAFIEMGTDGASRLWVQSLDELAARPLAGTERVRGAFWSPDSRFIAYFAGGKVMRIDANGGPPLALADANSAPGGAWSRGGTILFASFGPGNPLRRVPASGGAPSLATTLSADNGETQHWFPFFLPDDLHFLFLAIGSKTAGPNSPSGTYITTLDSNERKLLVSGGSNVAYAQGHLFFLREQTLMAQRFNVERFELAGDGVPIAEGVTIGGTSGVVGDFSVSEVGVLAYRTGPAAVGGSAAVPSQPRWFDRRGQPIGLLGDQARAGDLKLAPDGRRVAMSIFDPAQRNRDIWLFDVARGLRTRFTFDPAEEWSPIWSPDGNHVVFNSRRKGPLDLYQKATSGPGVEEELLVSSLDKFPLDWSPDGRFILFSVADLKTGLDLWVLPLFGDRKPFPVMQTPFREGAGRFSPDGRWIALSSDESGRTEVYVVPFRGVSGAPNGAAALGTLGGKWQISTTGGNWPQWRRDGKEIFYLAPANKMMGGAVLAGEGSRFEVGAVRPLFDMPASGVLLGLGSNYDVSSDGQRFLVNTLVEEDSPSITLVVNWPALLKE
jgi:eukaryotic-like serine/threonine-protein kinase